MNRRELLKKALAIPAAAGGLLLAKQAKAVGLRPSVPRRAEPPANELNTPIHHRFVGRDLDLHMHNVNLGGCEIRLSWDGLPTAVFEWSGLTAVYLMIPDGRIELRTEYVLRRGPHITGIEQLSDWQADTYYYSRYTGPRLGNIATPVHDAADVNNLRVWAVPHESDLQLTYLLDGLISMRLGTEKMVFHAMYSDCRVRGSKPWPGTEHKYDVTAMQEGPRVKADERLNLEIDYILGPAKEVKA